MTQEKKGKTGKILAALILAALIGLYLWGNDDRFFTKAASPERMVEFGKQIRQIRAEQKWRPSKNDQSKLTREILLESFAKGREFLLANQKPEGNFNYEYDFVNQTMTPGDNQVRQAGALWGIALCHQFEPTAQTRAAMEKGLEFFFQYSKHYGDDALVIHYPGDAYVLTGTIALVAMSLIDYLRAEPEMEKAHRAELTAKLDGYLNFLLSQQFDSGTFSTGLVRGINMRIGQSNQYFDGESLLVLSKAAKYLGRDDLIPAIEKAAATMAVRYTVDAWEEDPDSRFTKGFYQWGSMSFWEYQDAGWTDAETFAETTLALAWWMIHTHKTLKRTRNTGYAYEGLIHAYRIATQRNDPAMVAELRKTIDKGLYKLTSWQVEGPLVRKNKFLRKHRTDDSLAIGGVMNHRRQAPLRIDVTQHQMHAVILALRYVYF